MSLACLACGKPGAGEFQLSGPLGYSFVAVHSDRPVCVTVARCVRRGGKFTPWPVEPAVPLAAPDRLFVDGMSEYCAELRERKERS